MTIAAAGLMLLVPLSQANPIDDHAAAMDGADRMLDVQFDSGAMPWIVGSPGEFQNVQGVTAQGFTEAYKISLDGRYLGNATSGAVGVATWLADQMAANPGGFVSSGNIYFLAELGLLTGNLTYLDLARDALANDLALFDDGNPDNGGAASDLANVILEARANSDWTNLGLWDLALFVRAAHDIGNLSAANEFADVLATQTVVDPFDSSANVYEIGLTGLLFGLSEEDIVDHRHALNEARDALVDSQCFGGSFSITWEGEAFCGDVQTTAYAVLGLTSIGDLDPALYACSYLESTQTPNGGWISDSGEFAEVDGEAVQALASCVLPARNGATSYGDVAVGLV